MGHPLRIFIPNTVYEVTTRAIQSRCLLRPSETLRKRIIGVIARGVELYDIDVHAFVVMSNHWHLLASVTCGEAFSLFLGYANSNIALECGRAHEWEGPFWGRRARDIPCLDDAATIARLRYIVSHGVKENLVASPLEWPGASAVPALLGDMTLQGESLNRDAYRAACRAAARKHQTVDEQSFTQTHELRLTPLPVFRGCSAAQLRAHHAQLVAEVTAKAAAARAGTPVLGVAAVEAQDPHAAPATTKRSAAPACHTTSVRLRQAFHNIRRALVSAYRTFSEAAARVFSPRKQRLLRAQNETPAASVSEPIATAVASLRALLPPGMFAATRWFAPAPPGLLLQGDDQLLSPLRLKLAG